MLMLMLFILFTLTGCSGGAVVFAPTPLPPEAAPLTYTHPAGVFRLVLPPNWSVYEQSLTSVASASFAPPDADSPLVQVASVNLGRAIGVDELVPLMEQYQTQVRPDLQRYTEQERTAMSDGSFRISGLRSTPSGTPQPVNTFIQRDGAFFSVIQVTVPADAARRTQIQTIVNTFDVLPEQADLPVAALSDLSATAAAPLEIANVATWTTSQGVFYITGEVVNNSDAAVSDVPVQASLLTATGAEAAGAVNTVMGYAIAPGGFAPFGLRFGQGQPPEAERYTVAIGSDSWQPEQPVEFVGAPVLQWTDSTEYTSDGNLFISGSITNTGDEPVRQARAVVTVFDDGGRVIGAGFSDADSTVLEPQSGTSFTVLINELGGNAANYIVDVQALPCDEAC
jgi:hypothetical protein